MLGNRDCVGTKDDMDEQHRQLRRCIAASQYKQNLMVGMAIILLWGTILIMLDVSRLKSYLLVSPAATSSGDSRTEISYGDFHVFSHACICSLVNESSIISWASNGFEAYLRAFNSDLDLVDHWNQSRNTGEQAWGDTTRDLIFDANFCSASKHFAKFGSVKRHILLTHLNENWGGLSSYIPNRTINWGDLESHWRDQGCSKEDVMAYLDHNLVLGVFTTQHQDFDHPKVHSIPLGVGSHFLSYFFQNCNCNSTINKTQLLMINQSPALSYRQNIAEAVISNFNGTVNNTYGYPNIHSFYDEIQRSKFVLCPPGLGWDTYRTWETLYLGSFPIIERFNRTDGFFRTFQGLPVLFVDNMETDVTPRSLDEAYMRLTTNTNIYNYRKLTVSWWIQFANSLRNKS